MENIIQYCFLLVITSEVLRNMGKFNIVFIFIATLIAIAASMPMVEQEARELRADPCKEEPIVYCNSALLQKQCGKEEFCKSWPGDGIVSERIDIWKYYWDPLWNAFSSPAEGMKWAR